MKLYKAFAGSTALALSLSGTAALADVTSAEVWGNWLGMMESSGYDVVVTEDQSGATLSTTVDITVPIPDENVTIEVATGPFMFTDQGDGTVAVTFESGMPVDVTVTEDGDVVTKMAMTYSHSGLNMVVSGTPDEMTYDVAADVLGLALANLEVEGEVITTARMKLALNALSGSSVVRSGELISSDQELSAASLSYDVAVADPEGSGQFTIKGMISDLKSATSVSLPEGMDPEKMNEALAAGFAVDASLTYGGGNMAFNFVDGSDMAEGDTSSAGGGLTLKMNSDSLHYGVNSTNATVNLTAPDIPMPVNFSLGEVAVALAMPLAQSKEPGDISLLYKFVDLSVDDALWGMFDPTGQLPHDPATLIIDVAGKANWLFDIFDQEAAMNPPEPPAELHSLQIKELELTAVGASLTGVGSFTFDNSDLETFDGLPAPSGKVSLKLSGAYGLMDTLVAMGLLSNEDVQGAQMMMGMFARPGDGEDTLVSDLEVKSDGSVFANGMQLQ